MIRILIFAALYSLFFTTLSCKEDLPTIIKGTIVDSETGKPVSNALIAITNSIPDKIGLFTTLTEYANSDSAGHFSYTLRSDAKSGHLYTVSAENYATKRVDYQEFKVEMEATNEFTIPLVKLDATLQIHVKNQHEQDEKVYIVISNPTRLKEARNIWGEITFSPLNILVGEEKTYVFPVRSNEYTTIYWGGEQFFPYETAPFRDSLFFNAGEVLSYDVEF